LKRTISLDKKQPVIIFGEHISAYGVVRGLSKYKIPMYVVTPTGNGIVLKSRYIKDYIVLRPFDLAFIEKLDDWIDSVVGLNPVFIVAGDDNYLDVLSKRYKELRNNIHCTFPDWDVVQLVREKHKTCDIARELNIPLPNTYHIKSREELINLISDTDLSYPMFMKAGHSSELLSNYGIKGCICSSKDDLLDKFDRYGGFGHDLLLQDVIQSEKEIIKTVLMVVNKDSNPTGYVINEKKRSEGQYLSGSLVQSAWDDNLLKFSIKLVNKIGYYGYAGVQFKYDFVDKKFKLLEINGRISMSNSIALRCGTNLPYLMYLTAIGKELPEIKNFRQEYPDKILWWLPVMDIIGYFRWNKKFMSFSEYIRSLIGRGYVIEPMNWRDPLPGLVSIIEPFKSLFRKIFRINKEYQ